MWRLLTILWFLSIVYSKTLLDSVQLDDDCMKNPDDPDDTGIYICKFFSLLRLQDVDDHSPRVDQRRLSVPGHKTRSNHNVYKLNLQNFNQTAFPQGVSLYVQLKLTNEYIDFDEDAEALLRMYNEDTRHKSVNNGKYTHSGFYDLQTSPHELKPMDYYVQVSNPFEDKEFDYEISFTFNRPHERNVDQEFQVRGDGDQLYYYYINLTSASAPPQFVNARLNTELHEETTMCQDEEEFIGQFECEATLLMKTATRFYGTEFPMCLASDFFRRGKGKDCWEAASIVGHSAANLPNMFKAYQTMCGDPELCEDGCRHGIVEGWAQATLHQQDIDDSISFLEQAEDICATLENEGPSCFGGLGAGMLSFFQKKSKNTGESVLSFMPKILEDCERVTGDTAKDEHSDAINWCLEGAFRRYMMNKAVSYNDTAFEANFKYFCSHDELPDDDGGLLRKHCHEAQAFAAVFRARGDRTKATQTCGILFKNNELPDGGQSTCERAIGEYLSDTRLFTETNSQCDRQNLESIIFYNLNKDYSSGQFSAHPVREEPLSWFGNGSYSVFEHVRIDSSGDDLWWFAVDANNAGESIDVLISSTDIRGHPSPTTANIEVGDLQSRHDIDVESIDERTTSSVIEVYGWMSALFVTLKLLLLLWLKKKLSGYELVK